MKLLALWEWLTKSRYTRRLEQENEELRAALRDWQNAMLESVNLPRITPREKPPPMKLKKRLMPSQWRRKAELAAVPKEESA